MADLPNVLPPVIAQWLVPVIIVGSAVFAGWIADRVVMSRLRAWAHKTAWGFDDLVFDALRGVTLLWCMLIGFSIAVRKSPLDLDTQNLLGDAIRVAWIVSFTVVLARVAGAIVRHFMTRGALHGASTIATISVQIVVFAIGFLIALQNVGIQIMPILGALGVGGLAVALALQDTLANMFAGLHILASQSLRIGDSVRLESGEEGNITDITWRYTTISTSGANQVVVPNAKLASAIVTNFTLPIPTFILVVPVEVAYGSDLEKVERIALEVMAGVDRELAGEGQASARFAQFATSGIELRCIMPVRSWNDQFKVRHWFIKALHARFAQEKIEIPFPHQVVINGNPIRS